MKKSLEQQTGKRAQRDAVQRKVALLLARLTSRQGRLLFVPNEVLIQQLGLSKQAGSPAYKVRRALQRLESMGLVTRNGKYSDWSARLTPKGETYARKLDVYDRLRKKPVRWDGRWRMVIFDVWERRRLIRDKLRRGLQNAGFYKVQDSVWAYPYDCEELLVFLRADLRLGSGVLYVIAEGIEGDERLRRHFELNRT